MSLLIDIYGLLHQRYGDQSWWPGNSQIDVVVGAILTQAVSWRNVELAIRNLEDAKCIDVDSLNDISLDELSLLIKPSGYHNAKAKTLKAFAEYLVNNHSGSIDVFLRNPAKFVREELLALPGIGPETSDDIMVYAAGYASFIIDAYTIRIFTRIGIRPDSSRADYNAWQKLIHANIPEDVGLFNEYHALLVQHAKAHCTKTNPKCIDCCLLDICRTGSSSVHKVENET